MIALRLSELADVVGGVLADAVGDEVVTGPATLDSRDVPVGGLFVAVAGERVDGHDFAAGAYAAGAAGVLASRPVGAPAVLVDDPTAALGRLARHVRDRLPDLVVTAMTGSQGKTGTKDYLAAALRHAGRRVVATRGNLNNELGVPLTVLRADETTRHLVVEMGARGVGHIALLCEIARPDVAAVLNVGSAHLGEFGSVEAIARAKGEIVEGLAPSGAAVLAADDPRVAPMAARTRARVVTFGTRAADVVGDEVVLDAQGRASFRLRHHGRHGDDGHPVSLALPGRHQVPNATAAAALALAAEPGLDPAVLAAGLTAARPDSRWRMETTRRADGLVVLNDAYNANPDSMRAALATLADLAGHPDPVRPAGRRRSIAVLGEMKELGASAYDAHRAAGEQAATLGLDVLVVVDGHPDGAAAGLADGAEAVAGSTARPGPVVHRTAGREEARRWVRENVSSDDVVLLKASRGVALESLAETLLGEERG